MSEVAERLVVGEVVLDRAASALPEVAADEVAAAMLALDARPDT